MNACQFPGEDHSLRATLFDAEQLAVGQVLHEGERPAKARTIHGRVLIRPDSLDLGSDVGEDRVSGGEPFERSDQSVGENQAPVGWLRGNSTVMMPVMASRVTSGSSPAMSMPRSARSLSWRGTMCRMVMAGRGGSAKYRWR